jgi:hypothetical protein
MPGFDGTGPMGMGPMTGGGRGFCNPYSPLGAAGFAPPAYWPRPVGSPFGAGYYPQAPRYAGPMYGFPGGFAPQMMMGGVPGPWGGRVGFGRGLGMGFGRGMGMGFRGRGRYPLWGW